MSRQAGPDLSSGWWLLLGYTFVACQWVTVVCDVGGQPGIQMLIRLSVLGNAVSLMMEMEMELEL